MRLSHLWLIIVVALWLNVGGCANEHHPFKEWDAAEKYENFVPPDAQVVADGTGPLKYTATTNGTLYLLDLDDIVEVKNTPTPRVVATGGPLPGTEITFDPSTATVSPAGKSPLKLTKIIAGHRFQLRWMPQKD